VRMSEPGTFTTICWYCSTWLASNLTTASINLTELPGEPD
jgi:hypothetical protein